MTLRSLAANSPSRRADWRALGLSLEDPADEFRRRNGPGGKTPATGYLNTFRHDGRDMSTGGVLTPSGE